MFIIFWDTEGVLLIIFLECRTTIIFEAQLHNTKMVDNITRKRHSLLTQGTILLRDNALLRAPFQIMNFLQQFGSEVLRYSP
jgi:hypothetical protein